MKSLLIYFKGYLKETILGPVFKLLEASFELLVPLVIAKMVDRYIPHNDKNHLYLMIFFSLFQYYGGSYCPILFC